LLTHEGTINFSFKGGIVLRTTVSFPRMNLVHGVIELVGIIYKHIFMDVADVLFHVMKCLCDFLKQWYILIEDYIFHVGGYYFYPSNVNSQNW